MVSIIINLNLEARKDYGPFLDQLRHHGHVGNHDKATLNDPHQRRDKRKSYDLFILGIKETD
jgi:hypothetical protein